jgi:hypothetical protein
LTTISLRRSRQGRVGAKGVTRHPVDSLRRINIRPRLQAARMGWINSHVQRREFLFPSAVGSRKPPSQIGHNLDRSFPAVSRGGRTNTDDSDARGFAVIGEPGGASAYDIASVPVAPPRSATTDIYA